MGYVLDVLKADSPGWNIKWKSSTTTNLRQRWPMFGLVGLKQENFLLELSDMVTHTKAQSTSYFPRWPIWICPSRSQSLSVNLLVRLRTQKPAWSPSCQRRRRKRRSRRYTRAAVSGEKMSSWISLLPGVTGASHTRGGDYWGRDQATQEVEPGLKIFLFRWWVVCLFARLFAFVIYLFSCLWAN